MATTRQQRGQRPLTIINESAAVGYDGTKPRDAKLQKGGIPQKPQEQSDYQPF